jgi:N-carbamoylputrescine amidase
MKCALASMGFINEDIEYNKNVILETMIKYAKDADIVIFGEAFLQGFYGAIFEVEHDSELAISQDDSIIKDKTGDVDNQNDLDFKNTDSSDEN